MQCMSTKFEIEIFCCINLTAYLEHVFMFKVNDVTYARSAGVYNLPMFFQSRMITNCSHSCDVILGISVITANQSSVFI